MSGWALPQDVIRIDYSSFNPIFLILGDINIAATTSANKDLSDKVQTMIGELRNIFKEYLYLMHPKYAKGSGKNPFPSGKYRVFFLPTLDSVIDVGRGISVGPGRFGKKNKRRALNKRRAWKIWKKE